LHTAVRKGQDKGVKAITKLNRLLADKGMETFDLNAQGGFNQWTALHLAAHGNFIEIVKDLLTAGADVFQRNPNNQLPKHCAKGNYVLTKFIKMAEQRHIQRNHQSYQIDNQF
jgi:ankyrin repeat protein